MTHYTRSTRRVWLYITNISIDIQTESTQTRNQLCIFHTHTNRLNSTSSYISMKHFRESLSLRHCPEISYSCIWISYWSHKGIIDLKMKRVVLPAEHKGRCLAEYDGLNTDFIDFFSMQWKWRATDSISMIWTFICRVITVCERAATALKACFNSDTTLLLKHCSHVLFCVSVQSSEVICLIISFPFLSWSENTSYEAQIFSVYLLLWDQGLAVMTDLPLYYHSGQRPVSLHASYGIHLL